LHAHREFPEVSYDTMCCIGFAEKPAHGYDLLQEIESKTEGVWRPGAGSIYPILKELVNGGYIKAESHKKTGKQQHIYNITPEGRATLTKIK